MHKRMILEYGGTLPPLVGCVVTSAKMDHQVEKPLPTIEVELIYQFNNQSSDCKPNCNKVAKVQR